MEESENRKVADGWINVVEEKPESLSSDERKKLNFICGLGKLLKRNKVEDVKGLRYIVHRETRAEKVIVFFDGGGSKEVDVTADSLTAVLRDVLNFGL